VYAAVTGSRQAPATAERGRFRRSGYSVDGDRECHYPPRVAEEIAKYNHRRTLLAACIGVIAGFVGASIKGPELVSLLFKPLQDSFSCSGSVNLALTQFVRLQVTSALLGAAIATAGLFFWRRFFRRRAEAKRAAS
jgi:hypothetical protein